MKHSETAALLGMCAAYDARTIGEADVLAWHETLADVPFMDAKDAVVAHYRDSRDRIMPADVRRHAKVARAARLAHPDDIPDADPDDIAVYLKALRDGRTRRADGGTHELPALNQLVRSPQ